jgi:hypothetical protein
MFNVTSIVEIIRTPELWRSAGGRRDVKIALLGNRLVVHAMDAGRVEVLQF